MNRSPIWIAKPPRYASRRIVWVPLLVAGDVIPKELYAFVKAPIRQEAGLRGITLFFEFRNEGLGMLEPIRQ